MTIQEALNYGISLLSSVRIPSPALDVKILLEAATKKDRAFLLARPYEVLSDKDQQTFLNFLKRRHRREPVAKILQQKEFWSLPFKTTQDTLDPRPESETLIEAVLENFPNKSQSLKCLDFGTGTGCLLLTILREYPQAQGLGVDISKSALEVARSNAQTLGLEGRAVFVHSKWGQQVSGVFDIILANPPYLSVQESEKLEPDLAFDPPQALYADSTDGLTAYRQLAHEIPKFLAPSGKAYLEVGHGQAEAVQHLLEAAGLKALEWKKDLQGILRCGICCL